MSALKHLIAGLAGAGQAGVGYVTQKREREADEAKRRQDELFRQMQMDLQRQQVEGQAADRTFNQNRLTANDAIAAEDRERGLVGSQLTQYDLDTALPSDLAQKSDKLGFRTTRAVTPGKPIEEASLTAPVPSYGLGSPSDGPGVAPPKVEATPLPMPNAVGLSGVETRRGFKTADETAKAQLEQAASAAEAQGLTEMATLLRAQAATGGKLGGVSADLLKTPTQRAADARAAGDEQIRVGTALTGAQSAARMRENAAQSGTSGADIPPPDPESQNLLAQTGLSWRGFLGLTGHMNQVGRSEAAKREVSREIEEWAAKSGVDTATIQSQFEAYNDVLQANIQRYNRTKMAEGEMNASITNLKRAAEESGLTDARAVNATKQWLKGQLNDPNAAQYAFFLNQLTNDIALYNASSQGRATMIADLEDAKSVIQRGIASGSLTGMQKALTSSVEAMGGVLESGVNRARQNVWNLFGVGDKYKPTGADGRVTPPADSGGAVSTRYERGPDGQIRAVAGGGQ